MNNRGVYNAEHHQEEVEMLMQGKVKQFHLVTIDCTNLGFPSNGQGGKGLFELEGNAICVMPIFLDNDSANSAGAGSTVERQTTCLNTLQAGKTKPALYIKFNHPENPWLPFGLSNESDATTTVPVGYCLTFGRFWIWVARNNGANLAAHLLVTRGVSLYAPNLGPVIIGSYQAPTWQSLK
jgi:hypothetical protein